MSLISHFHIQNTSYINSLPTSPVPLVLRLIAAEPSNVYALACDALVRLEHATEDQVEVVLADKAALVVIRAFE